MTHYCKSRSLLHLVFATGIMSHANATEKQPDMAFLEYLANMVEVNGELVGPMDISSDKPIQISKEAESKKNESVKIKPQENCNEKNSANKLCAKEEKPHD